MNAWREAQGGDGGAGPPGREPPGTGDPGQLLQQRRVKQATRFLHKDSADFLPLDPLRRMGTSKDLQPHCVLQRRLVEGLQSGLPGASPPGRAMTETQGQEASKKPGGTETPAQLVSCTHG
ncbi:PREDICTED: nuclear receptor-interacting protein 2 [Dipodomys ordii]|uniref:Nuclear receptor-interacting protein 2 n=1 Tax=Dipodomys ordii TaxID=10020 RepID=A0A1S3FT91_DIPOR|nr:PREDICTED: nuclear receptor-interacting protein 2 [Dipodomys ordii]